MNWNDREEIWQWREAEEPLIISGFEGGAPGLWFSLTFLVVGLLTLLSSSSSQNWKPTDDGVGPAGMGLFFFGSALMAIGGWFLKTKWHNVESIQPGDIRHLLHPMMHGASLIQKMGIDSHFTRKGRGDSPSSVSPAAWQSGASLC